MKVKEGTQAGTKMNLTSRGIKRLQSDIRSGSKRLETYSFLFYFDHYHCPVFISCPCYLIFLLHWIRFIPGPDLIYTLPSPPTLSNCILFVFVFSTYWRGNHYVKILVVTPTDLTEKQKALLMEFDMLEQNKEKDERCWTKKFTNNLDSAWNRIKSFTGQESSKKTSKSSS